MSEPTPSQEVPRSAVEGIKEGSRGLRGGIGEQVAEDTDHFAEAEKQLLKFHGTYQQEDRDARKNRRSEGRGKAYQFMVRCKIPGGQLTAAQYLVVDDLAGKYANGSLRFTTRQGIQLHGVLKRHLKKTIAGINSSLLTTLGACGDVERNVMACPAPHHHDGVHRELQETARAIANHLAPRSGAYHEIWLDGQRLEHLPVPAASIGGTPQGPPEAPPGGEEPIYGKCYLPRKFKTGLAVPGDNCIDLYAQDLGFLALVEDGRVVGYNVLVGGGMGMSHGNAETFPYLARPICRIDASEVVATAEAVVKLFRDHGNRANRKRARIKYLVHDWGVERFREVLAGYLGKMPALPEPAEAAAVDLHLGWHPQGDGKWYYGLSVENGRVRDEGPMRLRSGLRAVVERYRPGVRVTPNQDVLLCDLAGDALSGLERMLDEYGIVRPEAVSPMRRHSLACPALPTCGLAIGEAERALPGILDQLEGVLEELGLEEEVLGVRMTGCPNGCARPYQADVGIVGRSGDKYTLFVGGHVRGDRLNFPLQDLVPREKLVEVLTPLLRQFKLEREPGESFGDYCHRLGVERLQGMLPVREEARAAVHG